MGVNWCLKIQNPAYRSAWLPITLGLLFKDSSLIDRKALY